MRSTLDPGSHTETDGRQPVTDSQPSHPLKVALVAPPYFDIPPNGYGGIENVVADIADGLVALGHHVTLIAAGKDGTAARLRPVWDDIVADRIGEPYIEVMHAILTRRAVQDLAAAREIDVVHDHTFAGPLNAAFYGSLGLPVVVTMHGPVDTDTRRYFRALGKDISLTAISNRQRTLAPELNWISTVYNGLNPSTWPFSAAKDDYALFLGRYHPDKGVHLAVEAAHAAGMPLMLAGKCSEPHEKRYFAEQIEPLLTSQDTVIGVADAKLKRQLLSRARCLIFPVCWEEPFGMVMIEAMVAGTPVVALAKGAVPEVVVDGVTGILCHKPEELAEAMIAATKLDSRACRRHVEQKFTAMAMSRGYENTYRRAIRLQKSGDGQRALSSTSVFSQQHFPQL